VQLKAVTAPRPKCLVLQYDDRAPPPFEGLRVKNADYAKLQVMTVSSRYLCGRYRLILILLYKAINVPQ
jgi:hypothetical protein